jgi:outer membrane protein OmpA-like peptidoglycan-associated protein
MKTIYIPIILIFGFSINANAQEKSRQEKQGDKYSFNYSYEKAIDSYTSSKKLSIEGQRKLAESYSLIGENDKAEAIYLILVESPSGVLPLDYYHYAMILKSTGKYVEANKWMDKFVGLNPYDLRSKSYTENKSKFDSLLKDEGKYKIEHLTLNTSAGDFGTSYFKNKIVFASTRAKAKAFKKKFNWNGKPFLDIYVSEVDGNQLKTPENFNKKLNGKMHDGPASFSNNGTYMAFTRNHYHDKSKDKIVELQIWFSSFTDNKWSQPTPFSLNNSAYSVGQPFLTSDGKTMYFICNMPGGFGGADIYKVKKTDNGEWEKPENLGNKINTEGDEVFPFLSESSETLYFSSNGHCGLGDLDIFSSKINGSDYGQVNNEGFPLNTQYDDFALIMDSTSNKGYFSSNRIGGSGDDDIYSISVLKILEIRKKLIGIAKDGNGKSIPNTFISLMDSKNVVIDTLTTKGNGAYVFFVESDKAFILNGKKADYKDGVSQANSNGKDSIIVMDVVLLKNEEVIVEKIEVGKDLGKVVKFNPIYFDYHEYKIRPDAEIELDKIVKIMNEYPNMVVSLNSHTDCRASRNYNQKLSVKRADASTNYIKKRITKPERISGKGYGETKLINGCDCDGTVISRCSEDQHQQNRRTEFIVVKK